MPRPLFASYISFLFILLSAYTTINCQTVVNSAGNTLKDNSYYFEYSIGEVSITTLTFEKNNVTQGLLQPIFTEKPAHAFSSDIKRSVFKSSFRYLSTHLSYTDSGIILLQSDKIFNVNRHRHYLKIDIKNLLRASKYYENVDNSGFN